MLLRTKQNHSEGLSVVSKTTVALWWMMVALCCVFSFSCCAQTSVSLPSSSSGSLLARRQGHLGEDVLVDTAVLSTNAFPSLATRSGEVEEEEEEENDAWLTDVVVVEVFSDDDEGDDDERDDDDDDDDDVEVTVRGFETVDFYDVSLGEESKGSEENEEEREEEEEEEEEEADEEFAADDVDNDDEEDDDFHPTYWEIAGEIEDQDFVIEYPPLPLLRGKDADEIEMWASSPAMFWSSKETQVTYVVQNDVRSHIDCILQRVILKTLYLGLTMFVLVVFVLDTCCGCVFNETSPDEFEHNFDGDEERGHWERLHDRFEQPLYFDTAYKTFREFPAPTKAKPASTQTSCVV